MPFVVAFDGTPESRMGLERAVELAPPTITIVAFAVVPTKNTDWARERGLLDPNEEFTMARVTGRLQEIATDVDERVTFEYATVDRYAPTGRISHRIRAFARDEDAKMVFVGSKSAGGIVNSLQSVGTQVASDDRYDIVIVRRPESLLE